MSTKILQKPFLDSATTTILVTGASGYIGANIIREALDLGYKVRGTARNEEKAAGTRKLFGSENYSTVIIADFGKPSQEINDALQGVNAVIHVASDTSFSEDPEHVVGGVVRGTKAMLEAATHVSTVKRFVLTSSSTAVFLPRPNEKFSVDVDTWNDAAVDHVYDKPGEPFVGQPYAFAVYAASKTAGERAFWEFAQEQKPKFQQTAILPDTNIGRIVGVGGPTGSMVPNLYKDATKLFLPPQYFIDVVDCARLHLIAAVLDEDVVHERIFAFASPFNSTDVINAVIKARPEVEAKIGHLRDENEVRDLSTVPNERGAELLRRWYGQDGYVGLEESVKQNLQGL